ncbi:hypothetical protein IMAU80053_02877 [Lactiplantibacillus plantarum]|nr:hypothetical protein A8P51_05280 [Lactiplantibacillus plantarum]ARW34061.1 hypothetical protein S102022_00043 [Lactiplantibacillus plantarum]MCG0669015.1 hypothetical protein [Lactiplantibacillus plantarum]
MEAMELSGSLSGDALDQFSCYDDGKKSVIRRLQAEVSKSWEQGVIDPKRFKQTKTKQIERANTMRQKKQLKPFGIKKVQNAGTAQLSQQRAEVGRWLEKYGPSLLGLKGSLPWVKFIKFEMAKQKACEAFSENMDS